MLPPPMIYTTCMQHHTLVNTSFNLIDIGSISYLISEFFYLKLGASRCLLLTQQASSMGPAVKEEGGGGQQASSLVAKQAQAVEFPQVYWLFFYNYSLVN